MMAVTGGGLPEKTPGGADLSAETHAQPKRSRGGLIANGVWGEILRALMAQLRQDMSGI